jgi:hypothetical protein
MTNSEPAVVQQDAVEFTDAGSASVFVRQQLTQVHRLYRLLVLLQRLPLTRFVDSYRYVWQLRYGTLVSLMDVSNLLVILIMR